MPLNLTPYGMQGCLLWHNADVAIGLACQGTGLNTAEHHLWLPINPTLTGANLFLQAWTLQPSFNSLGVVLSNGLDLTIGDV